MELITKLIDAFKIPLKVLLPSLWIFSSVVIFSPDTFLKTLGLLEWKVSNKFVLGLTFLITSSLLAVYLTVFLKNKIESLCYKIFRKRLTLKKIMALGSLEQAIIFNLYRSPTKTETLDFGEPIIQGLLSRNYIYCGSQQITSVGYHSTSIPIKFTLQPFVTDALDYYNEKLSKETKNTEDKIKKNRNKSKSFDLEQELRELQEEHSELLGYKQNE